MSTCRMNQQQRQAMKERVRLARREIRSITHASRIKHALTCYQCGREIRDNDDAHVCVQCGGMNLLAE